MPRQLAIAALLAGFALAPAGCASGGDAAPDRGAETPATQDRARTAPDTTAPPPQAPPEQGDRAARPPVPRCPAGAGNCSAAGGRIVALESVDPDGDGDLHVVVLGGSVTAPGITVLDVGKDLRPAVDPEVGDWAAGAGPVYRGSYGQRQIEVDEVVFDPRRG